VHPGQKTVMHYVSCSGGPDVDPNISAQGHDTLNLCFCIQWDLHVT
jgi:hypothetical protein